MIVNNQIDKCYFGGARILDPDHLNLVVLHRISFEQFGPDNQQPIPDEYLSGAELYKRFQNLVLRTGGRIPYHILIKKAGSIEQMLPLSVRGSHALGVNYRSWAVAMVGNFDKEQINKTQLDSVIECCKVLCVMNNGLVLSGHTEIPNASSDPNKNCPGQLFPLDHVKFEVAQRLKDQKFTTEQSMRIILNAGFVF